MKGRPSQSPSSKPAFDCSKFHVSQFQECPVLLMMVLCKQEPEKTKMTNIDVPTSTCPIYQTLLSTI